MNSTRWIFWLAILCLAAVLSPLVFSIAGGVGFSPIGSMVQQASSLGLIGLVLLVPARGCATALGRGLATRAMVFGLGCCAAAFIGWAMLRLMPMQTSSDERVARIVLPFAALFSAVAAVSGLAGLLILFPQPIRFGRVARGAAIVAAAVLGAFVVGVVAWFSLWSETPYMQAELVRERITAVAAVGVAAVLLFLLAAAIAGAWPSAVRDQAPSARNEGDVPVAGGFVVALRCPRCGHRQTLASGGAVCSTCGLRIRVEAA